MNDLKFLIERNFKLIAKYCASESGPIIKFVEQNLEKKEYFKKRRSIVYCLVFRETIMYVGESCRGFKRPLRYLNNKVMKEPREGVKNILQNRGVKDTIDVYVREFAADFILEDLELDLRKSYEQGLILKFAPKWNKKNC